MFIRDVLTVKADTHIYSVAPDTTIAEAVKQMVEHAIGSLAVMQDSVLVGFVTERDIVHGMYAKGCSLADVKVSDIMNKEPVVAGLDDSVDYARDVMTKQHIGHLIVMDGSQFIGIISFHDVAKACVKKANYENALLKRYIKHWPE